MEQNDSLFNLNKFRKLKKNNYENKEICMKNVRKWGKEYQTNPKFQTFDQKFFTAGDYTDIDKYGILSSMYYLSEEMNNKKKNHNTSSIKNENNKNILGTLSKLYNKIDITSIIHTFTYMFYKFKKGIFIIIHDGKLVLFLPFSNHNYINNWYDKIYFSLEEKNLLEKEDYSKIKPILQKNIIEFMNKYPEQFGHSSGRKIDFKREHWTGNGCVFRNLYPVYEGDLNIDIFKSMIETLCKERNIPNVQFFINYRDFPILKNNLTEPYNHLFDSDKVKIEKEYMFSNFCPIFSQSATKDFADILIPTSDEWVMHTQKYFSSIGCTDTYNEEDFKNMIRDWSKKKNIAVFRGSATQCGSDIDTNQRLKAALLGKEYPKLLDVGITGWKERMKKYKGEEIKIIDKKQFTFDVIEPLTRIQQSGYKYILHIAGYVEAFRLASEFRMHSVVLIVDSDYKLWFSHLLEPYIHYIPVKSDLSDLVEIVKWCQKNDSKCKKIANNGYNFYEKYLNRDGLLSYLEGMMTKIYNNKVQIDKQLVLKKIKKKVAIIVCYRDSSNGSRKRQKDLFIKIMSSLLSCLFNVHIYIIEQSQDGLFNIGKLKNIGFEISCKEDKYDHFIFSDIDMIPNYDLLPYYTKKFDNIVTLAASGTRYNTNSGRKPFTGGVLSINKKIFEKINGYPNNMRGWGGEDDSLLIRMAETKYNKLGYPKKGAVIDLEEDESGKKLGIKEKLKKLENNNASENLKFEKLLLEVNYWKDNGLNSLLYKILDTQKVNMYVTQIKVDLCYVQEEKNYKQFYPKKVEFKNNKDYKQFKHKVYETLNHYYHQIKIEYI